MPRESDSVSANTDMQNTVTGHHGTVEGGTYFGNDRKKTK